MSSKTLSLFGIIISVVGLIIEIFLASMVNTNASSLEYFMFTMQVLTTLGILLLILAYNDLLNKRRR